MITDTYKYNLAWFLLLNLFEILSVKAVQYLVFGNFAGASRRANKATSSQND